MPAGGGDPYIETIGKAQFLLKGQPGRRYRLYRGGGVEVLGRVLAVADDPEGRTYFGGFDVELSRPGRVVTLGDGRTHVLTFRDGPDGPEIDAHLVIESKHCTLDAPGHFGCIDPGPHPLRGVAHLNIDMPSVPADRSGESGLWVDGDRPDAREADYEVPG
jgi:hypothetical protein